MVRQVFMAPRNSLSHVIQTSCKKQKQQQIQQLLCRDECLTLRKLRTRKDAKTEAPKARKDAKAEATKAPGRRRAAKKAPVASRRCRSPSHYELPKSPSLAKVDIAATPRCLASPFGARFLVLSADMKQHRAVSRSPSRYEPSPSLSASRSPSSSSSGMSLPPASPLSPPAKAGNSASVSTFRDSSCASNLREKFGDEPVRESDSASESPECFIEADKPGGVAACTLSESTPSCASSAEPKPVSGPKESKAKTSVSRSANTNPPSLCSISDLCTLPEAPMTLSSLPESTAPEDIVDLMSPASSKSNQSMHSEMPGTPSMCSDVDDVPASELSVSDTVDANSATDDMFLSDIEELLGVEHTVESPSKSVEQHEGESCHVEKSSQAIERVATVETDPYFQIDEEATWYKIQSDLLCEEEEEVAEISLADTAKARDLVEELKNISMQLDPMLGELVDLSQYWRDGSWDLNLLEEDVKTQRAALANTIESHESVKSAAFSCYRALHSLPLFTSTGR